MSASSTHPVDSPSDIPSRCRATRRSCAGILGSPCDVVVRVNGQPVSDRADIMLASGARLSVRSDGTWSYCPNPASAALVTLDADGFTYTLQTPSGVVDGNVTIESVPVLVSSQAEPAPDHLRGRIVPGSGTGLSALDPVRLQFELVTGHPALIELRQFGDSEPRRERAVVLLEAPKTLAAFVRPDGLISVMPETGFRGRTELSALVEGPLGSGEWFAVEIIVIPGFCVTDSGPAARNACAIATEAATENRPSQICKSIFTLNSSPVVRGHARPGAEVVGSLVAGTHQRGKASAVADAAGRWSMRFRNAPSGTKCAFTVEYASGAVDHLGYLRIAPPAQPDYREL